jgi:hypothetical protein
LVIPGVSDCPPATPGAFPVGALLQPIIKARGSPIASPGNP